MVMTCLLGLFIKIKQIRCCSDDGDGDDLSPRPFHQDKKIRCCNDNGDGDDLSPRPFHQDKKNSLL